MAAGPVLFWPVLAVIVPRWLWKARAHPGQRAAFLRLMARAVAHGLTRRTDAGHAAVRAWSGAPPPAPPPRR